MNSRIAIWSKALKQFPGSPRQEETLSELNRLQEINVKSLLSEGESVKSLIGAIVEADEGVKIKVEFTDDGVKMSYPLEELNDAIRTLTNEFWDNLDAVIIDSSKGLKVRLVINA